MPNLQQPWDDSMRAAFRADPTIDPSRNHAITLVTEYLAVATPDENTNDNCEAILTAALDGDPLDVYADQLCELMYAMEAL